MHAPDHSELLLGVADVLREAVLVELDDGAARRQLKAALHIIERVGRSVHRTPGYLVADIDDMLRTLRAVVPTGAPLGPQVDDAAAARQAIETQGWSTPFEDLVRLHDRLQGLVVALAGATPEHPDADRELAGLYRRMLDRESDALGLRGAA
jgi:hypothetical protein